MLRIRQTLKQTELGALVVFEVAVVVDVVARQVGEDRDAVRDIVHAPLVQPDAGHLHHGRRGPPVSHAGKELLHLQRPRRGVGHAVATLVRVDAVGRGVGQRGRAANEVAVGAHGVVKLLLDDVLDVACPALGCLAPDVAPRVQVNVVQRVLHGANQAGGVAVARILFQHAADEPRGGGLAVGARHAHAVLQPRGGVLEECARQGAQRGRRVGYPHNRHLVLDLRG
mmetsp:Transcript_12146/g.31107  ORF Transcript_12146/g.31107 Transcript_12146/m.31107 type:complete len:226 (-) Transcript_12146:314-991(-)